MYKILYVSDYSWHEIPRGGAENNDKILIEALDCDFIKSQFFKDGEGYDKIIVSNFFNMPQEGKDWLIKSKNLWVVEHDYKLFPNRLPHENVEIVNKEFYQAAKCVIFQSKFQKSIFDKYINIPNSYVFSANLWTDEELNLFAAAPEIKLDEWAIMDSYVPTKGTAAAIKIAEKKKISFDLIPSMDYISFIKTLSKYSGLIIPFGCVESFSRVAAEAKMCGLKVITNENCAFAHEEQFNWGAKELISYMREKREELIEFLKKHD